MLERHWPLSIGLSLAGALGCIDDDAGRFGPDGAELAEYRQEAGPSLSLSTENITLAVNESLQLTATHRDQDGVARDLSAEADWSSDDPSIAWVQRGTIVGVFPGITQINVSHGKTADSVAVAVTTEGLQAIEVATSALEVPKGLTATLRALGVFRAGARRDISELVSWKSSDEAIAAVDGTLVRARELGSVSLEASLTEVSGAANIAVTGARLLDLEIERQRVAITLGTTQQLRARGSFSDGSTIDVTDLAEWSSDNGNLATVDENGLVSAHSAGDVVVRARYLGHVAESIVFGTVTD